MHYGRFWLIFNNFRPILANFSHFMIKMTAYGLLVHTLPGKVGKSGFLPLFPLFWEGCSNRRVYDHNNMKCIFLMEKWRKAPLFAISAIQWVITAGFRGKMAKMTENGRKRPFLSFWPFCSFQHRGALARLRNGQNGEKSPKATFPPF